MGQVRTDTANQRAAKERVAERRRCPRCQRRAALSSPMYDDEGTLRECQFCGHQVGTSFGRSFGRDVTPEPGARRDGAPEKARYRVTCDASGYGWASPCGFDGYRLASSMEEAAEKPCPRCGGPVQVTPR